MEELTMKMPFFNAEAEDPDERVGPTEKDAARGKCHK